MTDFSSPPPYATLTDTIGHTPVLRLLHLQAEDMAARNNVLLIKLEGNNPAGSIKDRTALAMIEAAENSGQIKPGDTLIEATSGNTGIALAMIAASKGYRLVLLMPENHSTERRQAMRAFGAELILTPRAGGMELARDIAADMGRGGKGVVLDQFANPANPLAHYHGTGAEIWQQTHGRLSHFIAAMGTTGTLMGTARYLKEKNSAIRIIGCQPDAQSQIPGIRQWPAAYHPPIFQRDDVDEILDISDAEAEHMTRRLAREEGLLCGISTGAAVLTMLHCARQCENATLLTIAADRGDRYLSTGVFPA